MTKKQRLYTAKTNTHEVDPVSSPLPIYTLAEYSKTKTSLFEIIELKAGEVIVSPNYLLPHRRDYYMFVFSKSDNYRYWVDFQQYDIQPYTFYYSSPRQVYVKERCMSLDAIAILFTDAFLGDKLGDSIPYLPIIQNLYNQHVLKLSPADIAFLEDLLGKMLAEFGNKQGWQADIIQAYMSVLLIYLSRLYQDQYGNNPAFLTHNSLFQRFKTLLSEHYSTIHFVAEYASLLNVTPNHLNETIKNASGQSANQWIQERLTLEARRLLIHTNLSVKEISYALGFNEAAYFNRFFKRNVALTPQAFRQAG